MKNKNQHFVTKAYIKAWCDPATPDGAFVWTVDKTTKKVHRRSPKTLFAENDFYTVINSQGERLLELEDRLSEIENDFIALRRNKLEKRTKLDFYDRKIIALFASTMYARTSLQKNEQKEIWSEWLEIVENLPEELSRKIKQHPVYDQVVQLSEQPMPYHLFHFVDLVMPYVMQMNSAVLETTSEPGFITSDNPCFWFDPAIDIPTQYITPFGVGSPTLNILLPISPKQLFSLEIKGPDGYINVDSEPQMIDELNKLAVMNADEFIVLNDKKIRKHWF